MKGIKKTLGTVIIISILSTTLAGCSLLPSERTVIAPELLDPPKISYKTIKAVKKTIVSTTEVTGFIVPSNERAYCFQGRSGFLKNINFTAGDTVEKGDVLAELDTGQIYSQIRVAEISVKTAEINYNDVKSNPNSTNSDRMKAELNLEKEKILLESLKNEFEKHKLIAEASGVITFCSKVQVGSSISSGFVIFKIASPEDMVVEFEGPSAEKFKVGMKANLRTNKGVTITGTVVIDPTTVPPDQLPKDQLGKTKLLMRVKSDQIPQDAKFGDIVVINAELARKDNAIVIPMAAVRQTDDWTKYFVQILEDNVKYEKYVEVGIPAGDEIEILQGVNEGDVVVMN
jgi:membrane fusion protein, macrolide-specific efflux system